MQTKRRARRPELPMVISKQMQTLPRRLSQPEQRELIEALRGRVKYLEKEGMIAGRRRPCSS
ncbi:MAG TPA: hypothetical protein VMB05_14540 [Solirubrobacteraceae bacterium]|nr:hypothetical protein [Solirubrobacteraceae bacterium]